MVIYLFYLFIYFSLKSRDTVLGVMTCCGLETQGSNSRSIKQCFSSPNRPIQLRGSATLLSNGYQSSFPGIKRPGREVGHSTPFSDDVQNECSYAMALSMCLYSMDSQIYCALHVPLVSAKER